MSKIKECILKGGYLYYYKKDLDDFGPILWVGRKGLIRNIMICQYNDGINKTSTTMKIILIPIIKMAICRSIWISTSAQCLGGDLTCNVVDHAFRPSTLDDIEDWIKQGLKIG